MLRDVDISGPLIHTEIVKIEVAMLEPWTPVWDSPDWNRVSYWVFVKNVMDNQTEVTAPVPEPKRARVLKNYTLVVANTVKRVAKTPPVEIGPLALRDDTSLEDAAKKISEALKLFKRAGATHVGGRLMFTKPAPP